MKKIIFILLHVLFIFVITGKAQERIDYLKSSKIQSIQIYSQEQDGNMTKISISESDNIQVVLSYILSVKYENYYHDTVLYHLKNEEWRYRIIFEDQQDQIYYYNNKALIGKSAYSIDENTIIEFQEILSKIDY